MTQEQEKWLALQQETEGLEWFEESEKIYQGNDKELEEEWQQEYIDDEENQPVFYKWLDDKELEIEVEDYDENGDWLVCTDSEADEKWEESLDNYLEECIYPELQGNLKNYFDDEKWKRDAKYDGRGHLLAGYDGHECEQEVNGTTYYLYRQN